MPGGNYNGTTFNNVGNNGNWWTATANGSSNAYNRNMNYNNANVNHNNNNQTNGFSVRCLKDCSAEGGATRPPLFWQLHQAYLDARRHKRSTRNQLRFECNLESELLQLNAELVARTYDLRPGICFINEEPVKREIVAADFRDRVVHHLLFNWIAPIFERQFINDSYSCRVGKGTLFGIRRAEGFLRAASDDFRKDCWVLRLDIQGFFMAIDRSILHSLVLRGLDKAEWRGVPDRDLCEYLIRTIIFHEPLANARFQSPPEAWDDLPSDKSLMGSAPGCGLPIGNLTSQLFANVYLNALDHHIKRDLRIEWYGRYVDDMVLVHSEKQVLLDAIEPIRKFLMDRLRLTLHPRKTKLQPASRGFAFLGVYILPYRTYPGRRVVANFRKCMRQPISDATVQAQRVQSYLGFMLHHDAMRLMSFT